MLILSLTPFLYNTSQSVTETSFVAEGRERILVKGLKAFADRPLLGWGVANFDYAFDSISWPIKINNDVYVDKAHSVFLELLVTTGVLGLVTYLAIIVRVFVNLKKSSSPLKETLIIAFLMYIIHSQLNVISISEEIIFWVIAGISVFA